MKKREIYISRKIKWAKPVGCISAELFNVGKIYLIYQVPDACTRKGGLLKRFIGGPKPQTKLKKRYGIVKASGEPEMAMLKYSSCS